eukprot:scaffold2849_cov174-Amphora_coffeaeformis.AAC.5
MKIFPSDLGSLWFESSLELARSLKGSDDDDHVDDDQTGHTSATHYDDSKVLQATILLYGSVLLIIVLVFCWARQRFPRVYQLRKWIENNAAADVDRPAPRLRDQEERYQQDKRFLSWIWQINMVRDDQILRKCGMDALCFIRIARFGYKLRLVCANVL